MKEISHHGQKPSALARVDGSTLLDPSREEKNHDNVSLVKEQQVPLEVLLSGSHDADAIAMTKESRGDESIFFLFPVCL